MGESPHRRPDPRAREARRPLYACEFPSHAYYKKSLLATVVGGSAGLHGTVWDSAVFWVRGVYGGIAGLVELMGTPFKYIYVIYIIYGTSETNGTIEPPPLPFTLSC